MRLPAMVIEASSYLNVIEAAKLFPSRPSANAVWRWARKGIKARNGSVVTLKHVRSGKGIFTTREWCVEFMTALAAQDAEPGVVQKATVAIDTPAREKRPASKRLRDIERAEKKFDRQKR